MLNLYLIETRSSVLNAKCSNFYVFFTSVTYFSALSLKKLRTVLLRVFTTTKSFPALDGSVFSFYLHWTTSNLTMCSVSHPTFSIRSCLTFPCSDSHHLISHFTFYWNFTPRFLYAFFSFVLLLLLRLLP